MIKRIICIILWSAFFYFLAAIVSGVIVGLLMTFSDFDIVANADAIGSLTFLLACLSMLGGAFLGYRESLPGTKKSNKAGAANPPTPEASEDC
jgi:uncharacterized membrane protein